MRQVAVCVDNLPALMEAFWRGNREEVELLARKIGEQEHRADLLKSELRNQMSRRMLLPVDSGQLQLILSLQDDLADRAEDIAVLINLRPMDPLPALREVVDAFLSKNLECFAAAYRAVREVTEVLEAGFGGPEVLRVGEIAKGCAFLEHEADVLQREVIRALYDQEEHLTFISFDFWSRLISSIGSIADISENLSDRIRSLAEGS
jgi:uncharacterized protein